MPNRNSAIVAAALIVAGLAGTSFATAGYAEPARPQRPSQQTDAAIWASTCDDNVCESFDRDLRRVPTLVGTHAVAAEADALRQALSAALWSQSEQQILQSFMRDRNRNLATSGSAEMADVGRKQSY
ncbi:MAG: hypothetical protein EPO27_19665 [Betaproteobacteria bacterium]|nr:MAG: hypothetical protein EPO27_19665 [Betaproteobacteria bacterium]